MRTVSTSARAWPASPTPSRPMAATRNFENLMLLSVSRLHAPAPDGLLLDGAENHVLDHEADDDHRQEAGEDVGDIEGVLVLEDEPAEAALAGADAAHELGGDHGA